MENVPAGTLTPHDTFDWLDAAGAFVKGIRSAVRAFRDALRKQPVRKSPKAPSSPAGRPAAVAPPSWLDQGELPETYARTKVVAMVVSPFMIHVYWDLAEKDRTLSGPATLRFHDAGGGSFDVTIDLQARNWYVHLWSPEKRYYVELGVESAAGFTSLARSNTVETPRAWPVAEISERFTRVAPAPAPVAAPALESKPDPRLKAIPELAPAPPAPRSSGLPVPPPRAPLPDAPQPGSLAAAPNTPEVVAPPALVTGLQPVPPAPAADPVPPRRASDLLREKLAEFYSFRLRKPRPRLPSESPAVELPAVDLREPALLSPTDELVPVDWTARLESQFVPGVSSLLLGLPLPKKPLE